MQEIIERDPNYRPNVTNDQLIQLTKKNGVTTIALQPFPIKTSNGVLFVIKTVKHISLSTPYSWGGLPGGGFFSGYLGNTSWNLPSSSYQVEDAFTILVKTDGHFSFHKTSDAEKGEFNYPVELKIEDYLSQPLVFRNLGQLK